jgi:hypothetical protein
MVWCIGVCFVSIHAPAGGATAIVINSYFNIKTNCQRAILLL